MKLHHIAIWTFRLEELKEFYVRFFGGKSNEKYINPKKGFESYFISFGEGTDLELMSRTDVQNTPIEENRVGLTHFAFTFPSQEEVLRFTEQMRSEGYTIAGEPRTSGDGYFESVVLDPDGNRIECVYRKTANESKNKARQETDIENIPPVTLHTERLFLRPFEERDAETFFACCQNPNLGNNAGWPPHRTLDESRRILHSTFINQEGIWAVILKDTKQLIGSVGIIPDPKRENPQVRMLGYWLDESYWGKGYMTEAVQGVLNYGFEELRLSLITATCYPHNKRSQQVLKRNGFIYEGILHQAELTYNGNLVRWFEDYYPISNNETAGIDFLNENGTVDVYAVRDLESFSKAADGSVDPAGKLIGLKEFTQQEFDARDIEALKNSTSVAMAGTPLEDSETAKLVAEYEAFGVTYDAEKDQWYFNGEEVRYFRDVLTSNGESLTSGKFRGEMRTLGSGVGTIDIYTVRDYGHLNSEHHGTLTGIEKYSQEEFDEHTQAGMSGNQPIGNASHN